MKKMLLYAFFITFSLLVYNKSQAQDPQFTQFYATPVYINPGFTGAIEGGRANMIMRDQWSSLPNSFMSFSGSVDLNLRPFSSGVGVIATMDQAGTANLTTSEIGILYSYEIKINRDWAIRPGIQFGWVSRTLDFDKLVFPDQLNLDGKSGIASAENFRNDLSTNYFNFATGAVLYTKGFFFGVSGHNINEPNQSFIEKGSYHSFRYSVQTGYKFEIRKHLHEDKKTTLFPALLYKAQDKFDQLDIGVNLNHSPVVIGLWYRGLPIKNPRNDYINNDAVAFMAGVNYQNWWFGYSYDVTISGLAGNTGGSHEISASYEWSLDEIYRTIKRKKKIHHRRQPLVCPKFLR